MKIGKTRPGETCTTWGQCESGADCLFSDFSKPGLCLSKYSLFLNLNVLY